MFKKKKKDKKKVVFHPKTKAINDQFSYAEWKLSQF